MAASAAAADDDTKPGNKAAVAAATAAAVTSLMAAEVMLAMDKGSPVDTATGVLEVSEEGKPALRVRLGVVLVAVVVGADAKEDEVRPAVKAFLRWLLLSLSGDKGKDVAAISSLMVAFEETDFIAADWTTARA